MLGRLQHTLSASSSVFEVPMRALWVCSLGQITNALFAVGGQHRCNF